MNSRFWSWTGKRIERRAGKNAGKKVRFPAPESGGLIAEAIGFIANLFGRL